MKKAISILCIFCCLILCSCSTSYEQHIDNIKDNISKIHEYEAEIKEPTPGLTMGVDSAKHSFKLELQEISSEYKKIKSDEDKSRFLNYVKDKIPQETYDICCDYVNERQLHEDIWALYNENE